MPKLVYFLACERVLVNEESPTPSFVSVFDHLSAPTPPPDAPNPQAGMNWALVSLWKKMPEDEGKTFEQRTRIINPAGEISAETISQFTIPKTNHRNSVKIFGFPLAPIGDYQAQLFIREAGTEEWVQTGEYTIEVSYL